MLLNVQQNIKKRPFLMRMFGLPAGRANGRKGRRAFILKKLMAHGLHVYKNLRSRRKARLSACRNRHRAVCSEFFRRPAVNGAGYIIITPLNNRPEPLKNCLQAV
ncbi:hypothetical protein BWD09_11485 [Neisseria dentiae]|uniref:Uncharacterized protein n=1 Tax=Neisseria dentiae TaxID=194197 RepID=A0A1X3D2F7_9NEIS|nr:hypothetical protein BWD09_11485 [Neisseria dentiae]